MYYNSIVLLFYVPMISPEFPGGSVENNLPASARDLSLIPWLGRLPEEGNGNLLQILFWEIPGTEELEGCRLWGRTELDTTEVT